MNNNPFLNIDLTYGRPALRLIRRHERCQQKLARYTNHLTFLTRCIKNRIVPKDLRVRPPVPTKGARKAAELTSMRFLKERIRLTMSAKADAKREAESKERDIKIYPLRSRCEESTRSASTPSESSRTQKSDRSESLKNTFTRWKHPPSQQKQLMLTKLTGSLIYALLQRRSYVNNFIFSYSFVDRLLNSMPPYQHGVICFRRISVLISDC